MFITLAGDRIYVPEQGANRIRSFDQGGIITTIAGGGTDPEPDGKLATDIQLAGAWNVAPLRDGSYYVAEPGISRILRVSAIDNTAPATTITSAPAATTSNTTADFAFSSDETGVSYACRLDAAPAFTACPNPASFTGLSDGSHTLAVRATDTAGNLDASPAQHAWTVDTTAPAPPRVYSGPDGTISTSSASFEFGGAPGSTFACSLDGAPFTACASPAAYTRLADGQHTFAVRETDQAGNTGAPSSSTFTVAAVLAPKPGPVTPVHARLTVVVAAKVAANGRSVMVGCRLNRNTIASCRVAAYHHGRKVGAGTASYTDGSRRGSVTVALTRTGRKAIATVGGARVRFTATATDGTPARVRASRTTTVLPQRLQVILSDGLFAAGSAALNAAGNRDAAQLAAGLKDARRIECVGHTDSRGDAPANYALGLRRAHTVCAALRRHGVNATQHSSSAGESQPRAANLLAAGRALNRRVEFHITF